MLFGRKRGSYVKQEQRCRNRYCKMAETIMIEVKEYDNGCIMLESGELSVPDRISFRQNNRRNGFIKL